MTLECRKIYFLDWVELREWPFRYGEDTWEGHGMLGDHINWCTMSFGELYLFCDRIFSHFVKISEEILEYRKRASSFWWQCGSGLSVTERSLVRYMQCLGMSSVVVSDIYIFCEHLFRNIHSLCRRDVAMVEMLRRRPFRYGEVTWGLFDGTWCEWCVFSYSEFNCFRECNIRNHSMWL